MNPLTATIVEALRSARAARAASGLVVAIGAGVAGAVIATTGQTAAVEQQVVERFDEVSSRVLTIRSTDAALIQATVLDDIARLSSVDAVLAVSAIGDGRNDTLGPAGPPAAVWRTTGDIERFFGAATPNDGQALITPGAAHRLALIDGIGELRLEDDRLVGAVGVSEVPDTVAFLDPGVILRDDDPPGITRLLVVADDASAAGRLAGPVVSLLDAADPQALTVESPAVLADLEAVVSADLRGSGRLLLLGVLTTGALLLTGTVLGQVSLRRRDLGRRRALGASRSQLAGLVITQTTSCALLGAAIGITVSSLLLERTIGAIPPVPFLAGTLALTGLTAGLAALPPATLAARRDPLSVLRTP